MPYSSRSKFRHIRKESPRRFDPRSFRVKTVSPTTKLVIGCPKGKYSVKTRSCKAGTRVQSILRKRNYGLLKYVRVRFLDGSYFPMTEEDKKILKKEIGVFSFLAEDLDRAKKVLNLAGYTLIHLNKLCKKIKKHLRHDIKGFRKIEGQARRMRAEDVRELKKKNPFENPLSKATTTKTLARLARYNRIKSEKIKRLLRKLDVIQKSKLFKSVSSNPLKSPLIIYGKTHRIEMQKTCGPYKGQHFYHNFSTKPLQYGVPSGTVLKFPDGNSFRVTTKSVLLSGKKDLWKKFPR